MDPAPLVVLSVRDVEAAEVIDSGHTIAVHMDGTCGRRIVVTLPVRAGSRLVEHVRTSLDQAASERSRAGSAGPG